MTSFDKLLWLWWRHFGEQPASRCCAAALQGGQCRGQSPWLTPAQHSTAQHNDVPVDTVPCLWLLALFLLGPAGRDIHSSTPTLHVWSFITGLSFLKRLNRTNTFFSFRNVAFVRTTRLEETLVVQITRLPAWVLYYFKNYQKILYYYYFVNHKLLRNHDVGYKSIT